MSKIFIPLKEVVNQLPEYIFTSDQINCIGLYSYNIDQSIDFLKADGELIYFEDIIFNLFNGISITLINENDSTIIPFEAQIKPDFNLKLKNVSLKINISSSNLIPVILNEQNIWVNKLDTENEILPVEFEFRNVEIIYFMQANYISILLNENSTVNFDSFRIADTQYITEIKSVNIFLPEGEETPLIKINSSALQLPAIENVNILDYHVEISGDESIISSNSENIINFTGDYSLRNRFKGAPYIPLSLFENIYFIIEKYDVSFLENAINNSEISGYITFSLFEKNNFEAPNIPLSLNLNLVTKVYNAVANIDTLNPVSFNIFQLFDIRFTDININFDATGLTSPTNILGEIDIAGLSTNLDFQLDALPKSEDISGLSYDSNGLKINNFTISWQNYEISSGSGSLYYPVQNPNFIPGLILEGIEFEYGSIEEEGVVIENNVQIKFVGAGFKLGPVTAVIEGLGLSATITQSENGNLGPVNVQLGINYPTGVGVSLDTDIMTGGGFLMFDNENNTYAGALELSFKGLKGFSLTAIGILTTQMSNGSSGTSLLVIITAVFPAPIPIGFNFYLAGVGGLLGLHRTINLTTLQNKIKTGAVESILFPTNVIANISTIISNLQSIFPLKQNQFIVGPMAKITWNTPAMLDIQFGIMLEFANPTKIAIIVLLKSNLPNEQLSLIALKAAFLGTIDFQKKLLSFDASIYDSRILNFTLNGDMALRLSWGSKKDFLVSMGGFHPVYQVPAYLNLPSMNRMTINFLTGNPSLSMQSYFAITTNTLQFGSKLDFKYIQGNIDASGKMGYDVLVQFSPLLFMADVVGILAVKWKNTTMMTVSLLLNVNGPAPWKINGNLSFKILGFTIDKNINISFGQAQNQTLSPIQVFPLVKAALENSQNWRSEISQSVNSLVRLKEIIPNGDKIFIKSEAELVIEQNIAPLNLNITKFGNYTPQGVTLFDIKEVKVAGAAMQITPVYTEFSPASFKTMSDANKLNAPSFETMKNGVKVIINENSNAVAAAFAKQRDVEYEVKIQNPESKEITLKKEVMSESQFNTFVKGGDIKKSVLSKYNRYKQESKIRLIEKKYVIVYNTDYSAYSEEYFISKTAAEQFIENLIVENPDLEKQLKVVPDYLKISA